MSYRGIVKEGKVELEPGASLQDGTPVRVEIAEQNWRDQWEAFAREVARKWQVPQSAVQTLAEDRR